MHKAAIFDYDGVIANTVPYQFKAWKVAFAKHGFILHKKDAVRIVYGKTAKDILDAVVGKSCSPRLRRSILMEKDRVFFSFLPKVKLIKGLRQFLASVRKQKIKTALATSTRRVNIQKALKILKLNHSFDVILSAEDVKKGKPDPQIFLKACRFLKMKPSECIVFEDSIAGVQAAKKAGMVCIALTTTTPTNKLRKADLLVKDFTYLS